MPSIHDGGFHSKSSTDTHIPDLEQGQPSSDGRDDGISDKIAPQDAQHDIGEELEKHLSRKSTKKDQLAPEVYPLSALEDGFVGWDSQDDPANPRNFSDNRKWFILGLIASNTFLTPFSSSIVAPGVPFILKDFKNTSELLGSFAVSVYVLGFAVGPLFLSSLSEIYGRCIVLNFSNVVYCAFTLGCALSTNLSSLIVMRFFSGLGGSACLTIGTGVIADLFVPAQRGKAVSIYSMGILFGPILGPLCGGFIAQRASWHWDFWLCFILGCLLTVALFFFNTETSHSILLERKTDKLRKELNRPELISITNRDKDSEALKAINILKQGLIRPLKMLFKSPIVLFCSLYMSFLFGLLYLLFTTITSVMVQTYKWSPEMTGLAYLGIGIGNFLGIGIVAKTSDATIIRLARKNNGVYEPEMRLPLCVFFGLLIPVSFFWYGWSAYYEVHWIVPVIGLAPFGIGIMGIFAPLQTYLIDCFPKYAASAVAGMTALRCIFGALLPLAGPSMYDTLGLGWGNSMLGFVAVAFIPVPLLLHRYGKMIREKWPIAL